MFTAIKFTAGRKAPARYIYCDKGLFKPSLMSTSSAPPLHLTEFKDIEILSESLGSFTFKCYFNDGTESLAIANTQTVFFLQKFIYNVKNTPKGQEPEIPAADPETWIFALLCILTFLICLLFLIR